MKRFPEQFSDLLTPFGMRVMKGQVQAALSLFRATPRYFVNLDRVVEKKKARACAELLDKHLYPLLAVEQGKIRPESISEMKYNYTESLNKTMRIKTAFFRRRTSRAYEAAERIGLIQMMRSESFVRFAEVVSGLRLNREWEIQVSCYGHGDYVGPHNDHHPEDELTKRGFIDLHVMFTNDAVAHQYLIYEEKGHFSREVDINKQGALSVYKLPFWHYTTPLTGKRGREQEARRWLLLGTFSIGKEVAEKVRGRMRRNNGS